MTFRAKSRLRELHARFGGVCHYCGRETSWTKTSDLLPTLDHLIPRSRRGRNASNNIALACNRCNARKGNMTEAEFDALIVAEYLLGIWKS